MPSALSGELTRHHNQPFYQRPNAPKYFWLGCLVPVGFALLVLLLAAQGATSTAGVTAIRSYLLFLLGYLMLQVLLGGGLFLRSKSSLSKGLLLGGATIFLLVILTLIGIFSTVSHFTQ
jgi:hypothetical protein